VSTERCPHCGYRIPTTATSCPGCARAHRGPTRRGAPRSRSALLRTARWTRRCFVVAGWWAVAAGVTAVAGFVAGRERVADDLDPATVARVGEAAHALVLVALGLAVLSAAALWTWAATARRNLRALAVERRWGTPWAVSGWLAPGADARAGRLAVDGLWRDRSPAVASLPGSGWSRRPISLVVLHWWTPWAGVPAVAALVAAAIGGPADIGGDLALLALAGAAGAVASLRALYDIVGVVTFAQAHRAERVRREGDASLVGVEASTAAPSSGAPPVPAATG
jgi:hypothetical protein